MAGTCQRHLDFLWLSLSPGQARACERDTAAGLGLRFRWREYSPVFKFSHPMVKEFLFSAITASESPLLLEQVSLLASFHHHTNKVAHLSPLAFFIFK